MQPWKLGSERTYVRNSAQSAVILSGVSEILSKGTGISVGPAASVTTAVEISVVVVSALVVEPAVVVGIAVVVVEMMLVRPLRLMSVLVFVGVVVVVVVTVVVVENGRSTDVWCRVSARRTNRSTLRCARVSASLHRPRPISASPVPSPATTPRTKVAKTTSTR